MKFTKWKNCGLTKLSFEPWLPDIAINANIIFVGSLDKDIESKIKKTFLICRLNKTESAVF